jgi:catabolite regulation protein CreA
VDTSIAALDYFDSILGNRLAIDEDDIPKRLFDEGSSFLFGSMAIAAFYERKKP